MPSYVRTRLLAAREFALGELVELQANHPAYDYEKIEDLRKIIGFQYYFFMGVDLDTLRTGENFVLMSDMPEAGVQAYHKSGLARVDPIITGVSREKPVLAWSEIPPENLEKPEVKPLLQLLELHQIPPRLMISLWNQSGQFYGTVGFAREEPFAPHEISILEWVGTRFHADLSAPILRGFNQQIGLTPSEKSCLELASQGKTSEEIAMVLKLSTETVNSYMKVLTRKLGAKNRSHAIADAIRLGIIQ